jgi:hypothetical protein
MTVVFLAIWAAWLVGYGWATLRNGAVVVLFDKMLLSRGDRHRRLRIEADVYQDGRWIADVTTATGAMYRGVGKTPARATLNAVKYARRAGR